MPTIIGSLRNRVKKPDRIFIMLAVVTCMSLGAMTEGLVFAAEGMAPARPQLDVFPEGEITGIGTTTLDIAGRTYGLHPKLTIVGDEGQQLELKQLRVGLIVQYHLKEGALDYVIVIIPR